LTTGREAGRQIQGRRSYRLSFSDHGGNARAQGGNCRAEAEGGKIVVKIPRESCIAVIIEMVKKEIEKKHFKRQIYRIMII